jgi:hypothetical protein
MFRYRLSDATDGRNLGWFASDRNDWKPGDSIGSTRGLAMIIVAAVEPEDGADFHAHLIVVSAQTLQSAETETAA